MKNKKLVLILLCSLLFIAGQAQVSKTINVSTPGTLRSLLTANELSTVTNLTVSGNIDARDFTTFRRSKMPNLVKVDISNVSIVEYNGTAGTYGGSILYPANELPLYAFYDFGPCISEVILPNSITSIGKQAFYWSNLTSVIIPDLVTNIGESAFEVCSFLKSVTFGKSVKFIGKNAFASCSNSSPASLPISVQSIGESAFGGWNILNLNLCDSLKTIGNSAFSGCRMSSVTIPNSVTSIGERAFSRSYTLTSIVLGNKLTSIPNLLFEGSALLSTVSIPNSVITIGNEAFRNCSGLVNFTIPASVTSIGADAFTNCSGLISLTIPGTLNSLGNNAFNYCSKLTSLYYNASVPMALTSGMNVFTNTDLTKCSLFIPYQSKPNYMNADIWKSFSSIIENPIGVCLDASTLKMSEKKNSTTGFNIKSNTTWTISSNQTWLKIDKSTGANNDSITLTAEANDSIGSRNALITVIDSNNIPQVISVKQDATLKVINATPGSLKSALTKIQKKIILKLKLTGAMNASDFKIIRDSLPLLTELDLGDVQINAYTGNTGTYVDYSWTYSANEIPTYAFYTNYGGISKTTLRNIKLPNSIKSFGFSAFMNCTGLSEISIPRSVNTFNNDVFSGCTGLNKICVNNRQPISLTYVIDNVKYNTNAFNKVDTTKCILRVPYNTKPLYSAASGWKSFKNIEEYPYYMFIGADTVRVNLKTGNKTSYAIKSNVSWTASTDSTWLKFKSATGVNNDSLFLIADPNPYLTPRSAVVRIDSKELESEYITVIQDGEVKRYAVTAGNLKTIIPASIKKVATNLILTGTMDARDFRIVRDSMPNLISVDLSKVQIVYYKGLDGTMQDSNFPGYLPVTFPAKEIPAGAFKRDYTLASSKTLTSIIPPDSIVSIGASAYYGCTGISEIKINNLITAIRDGAFEYCSGITGFVIPATVKSLGGWVFDGCTNLTNVTINAPITAITSSLFNSCSKLTTLNIPNTITSVGEFAFYGCGSLKSLVLPEGVKTIAQDAFSGCISFTEFTIPSSVTSIGGWCFANCHSLTKINAYGSKPSNITLGYCVFSIADGNSNPPPSSCKLVVPTGTQSLYAAADQWKDFKNKTEGLPVIVSTEEMSDVLSINPTGHGSILYIDSNDPTQYGFVWSTSPNPTVDLSTKTVQNSTGAIGAFTNTLTGLVRSTTYYVRAYATNTLGTTYGKEVILNVPAVPLLAITAPTVVTNKMIDGNPNAVIIPGTLLGVDATDAGNVGVTATATYNNANAGINKTITVVYTLTGSAKDKYLAPANYVISNAKISDYITLSPLSITTPGCEGYAMDLPFNLLTGTPTQYKITFNAAALSAGMKNVAYQNLSNANTGGTLTFSVPNNTKDGTYQGTVKMKNELYIESIDYPFTFTINVSADYIRTKFNDVVLFDNSDKRFVGYQWCINGIEIPGATKQFYCSPIGFIGNYSVKLTSSDGNTLYTCSKGLIVLPSKAQIRAFPNPVKENESCTVHLNGLSEDELRNAKLSVYNTQGVSVYESNTVSNENKLNLPINGAYIGRVAGTGIDYVFKLIVVK